MGGGFFVASLSYQHARNESWGSIGLALNARDEVGGETRLRVSSPCACACVISKVGVGVYVCDRCKTMVGLY